MTNQQLTEMGFIEETFKEGQWARWRHKQAPDIPAFALIIYFDSKQTVQATQVSNYLIKLGAYLKIQQFQDYEM